jgi:hypothetical protein
MKAIDSTSIVESLHSSDKKKKKKEERKRV